MNREEFLKSLGGLNVWKRGGERAPHKPLLLLLALGRLSQNENRLVRYEEVETRLRRLLESCGPPRKVTHPEFPFWHLQTDGIWEIPERENLPKKNGGTSVLPPPRLDHPGRTRSLVCHAPAEPREPLPPAAPGGGLLERQFPDRPNTLKQVYRTRREDSSASGPGAD